MNDTVRVSLPAPVAEHSEAGDAQTGSSGRCHPQAVAVGSTLFGETLYLVIDRNDEYDLSEMDDALAIFMKPGKDVID